MSILEQNKRCATPKEVNIAVKFNSSVLPLSCPPQNMPLWDMHPKVYLELDEHQKATCPYCSTIYILNNE